MKSIDALDLKPGSYMLIEGVACAVKNSDKSKTGKHGASKCRIEAIGLFDGKKRIIAVPGSERFEVPMIDKRRGQVLSINGNQASIMDLETFETLDVKIEEGVEAKEKDNVEYWNFNTEKLIKRVV